MLQDLRPGRGLERFLEFDQRYYLADDILYKVDRISMAHSLEVRPPFLDDRIVDFANRLPDDYKLRGSQSKYVLRRLMQNKLPHSGAAAAQDRLRHSDSRMVPRRPAPIASGNALGGSNHIEPSSSTGRTFANCSTTTWSGERIWGITYGACWSCSSG